MIYTIVVICVDRTEWSEYMPLLIRSRRMTSMKSMTIGYVFVVLNFYFV